MAFFRAAQFDSSPEREEYITAVVSYKVESQIFARARKLFKDSLIRVEHIKWLEARERYSIASKLYHAAKQKYANFQAVRKLEDKGIDVTALKLAQLSGISIPMSLKEMLEETRRERLIQSTPSEDMEEIKRVALAYMNKTPLEEPEYKPYKFGVDETPLDEPASEEPVESFDSLDSDVATCTKCGKVYDPSATTANEINKFCSKKCEKEGA